MATDNERLPLQGYDDHDAFQIKDQFASNLRNVRSLRERIVRSPGGTLLAPPPIPGVNAGQGFNVGSFTMRTTTGQQTIPHGLTVNPQAVMLVTASNTAIATSGTDYRFGAGWTDGSTERSVSIASDNTSTSNTARSYQNALLTVVGFGTTTVAQGTLVSTSAQDFIINWTTVDGVARKVIFCVIGLDTGFTAKVLEWTLSSAAGSQSVTGVGFTPQVVMHLHANRAATGTAGVAQYGFGAMVVGGEWSTSLAAADGVAPHSTTATMRTDQCIVMANTNRTVNYAASMTSMDVDGFTVNKATAPAAGVLITSLCLDGFTNVAIGRASGLPGSPPKTFSETGVGFQATALLASYVPSRNTVGAFEGDSDTFIGFTDGQNQASVAITDDTGGHDVASQTRRDGFLLDVNGNGGIDGLTKLLSFNPDGFTLQWIKGIGNVTAPYLAMEFPGSAGAIGIPRNYPEVYVSPPGPAIQKYVMLTSASAFIYTPQTSSTGIWTPTAETYTGGPSRRFSIANTQGIAAWSQGVDNIRQWDGTSFTDLVTSGTNQAADTLLAFNDRIIAVRPTIGGVLRPTQIRWCINGNVNNWNGTGSGSLEIIETSQAPLTGGFVLGDRAYVTKQRELIEIIATGTLNPVFGTANRVSGMGLLAPHSVGLAEQFAFWLGPDDVYMWDGSTLSAVGDRIYNTLTSYIDFQALDQIQGVVYEPDSQYWLVIPPYVFIYDYRRDIWDWDDVQNFAAIGVYNVSNPVLGPLNFWADIDKSEFIVIGDPQCNTTRVDFQETSWLGNPIDSYFETKDYTAEELIKSTLGGGWHVTLWDLNSLREVRFQSIPGNTVELAVSLDRGVTWVDVQDVLINSFGVGVAWFQRPFSMIRFRFRRYSTDSYEIRGQWGHDIENSGYQYP